MKQGNELSVYTFGRSVTCTASDRWWHSLLVQRLQRSRLPHMPLHRRSDLRLNWTSGCNSYISTFVTRCHCLTDLNERPSKFAATFSLVLELLKVVPCTVPDTRECWSFTSNSMGPECRSQQFGEEDGDPLLHAPCIRLPFNTEINERIRGLGLIVVLRHASQCSWGSTYEWKTWRLCSHKKITCS